jgi:hypothetical protein
VGRVREERRGGKNLRCGLHEVFVIDKEVREAELDSRLHDLPSLVPNVLEGLPEGGEGDVHPLDLMVGLPTELLPSLLFHF